MHWVEVRDTFHRFKRGIKRAPKCGACFYTVSLWEVGFVFGQKSLTDLLAPFPGSSQFRAFHCWFTGFFGRDSLHDRSTLLANRFVILAHSYLRQTLGVCEAAVDAFITFGSFSECFVVSGMWGRRGLRFIVYK